MIFRGNLTKIAGHFRNLSVLSDRPTIFAKTDGSPDRKYFNADRREPVRNLLTPAVRVITVEVFRCGCWYRRSGTSVHKWYILFQRLDGRPTNRYTCGSDSEDRRSTPELGGAQNPRLYHCACESAPLILLIWSTVHVAHLA